MTDVNLNNVVRCLDTHPSVLHSLLPTLTVLANTNDDVKTVVTGIQALTVALRPIPDESKGIIFEVVLELGQWPVASLVDNLLGSSEIESLNSTSGSL